MTVDKHPNYWAIWAWLAVLTVIEIFYSRITTLPEGVVLIGLLLMALWKALLVALFFMHLKFEGNRMRIFAIAPLPLTVIIVIAVVTEYVW